MSYHLDWQTTSTNLASAIASSSGATAAQGTALQATLTADGQKYDLAYTAAVDTAKAAWITTAQAAFNAANAAALDALAFAGAANTGISSTVVVTNGGSGYTTAPTVVFSAPVTSFGVTPIATATIASGAVTGITVANQGAGYTSAPAITFTGGGGQYAKATATALLPLQSLTFDMYSSDAIQALLTKALAAVSKSTIVTTTLNAHVTAITNAYAATVPYFTNTPPATSPYVAPPPRPLLANGQGYGLQDPSVRQQELNLKADMASAQDFINLSTLFLLSLPS